MNKTTLYEILKTILVLACLTNFVQGDALCKKLGGYCTRDVCTWYYAYSNVSLCRQPPCDRHCCLRDITRSCRSLGGYCYDPRKEKCNGYFITGICPDDPILRCCIRVEYPCAERGGYLMAAIDKCPGRSYKIPGNEDVACCFPLFPVFGTVMPVNIAANPVP